MNISKLTKRLRREAKTNPKKAAILGLLLLVAVYYWLPLLKGMVAKAEVAPKKATETISAKKVEAEPLKAMSEMRGKKETEATATFEWESLAGGLDRDPTARPCEMLLSRRSPFGSLTPEIAEVEPEVTTEPVQITVTPESLGMAVSGTVIVPGRRVALINGRAYREGRNVPSTRGGQTIEFKLAEVHDRQIVLERQGERFELAIPQRPSVSQFESFAD